jgi:hypothetical protein
VVVAVVGMAMEQVEVEALFFIKNALQLPLERFTILP